MKSSYSIHSAKRVVGVREASSPAEALVDYLYGQGCLRDEIVRLRSDALAWRGAVFTAAPVAVDAAQSAANPGPGQ